MKYPCELIKDLLPLYLDNIASEESKAAVVQHLAECEACRKYWEALKSTDCIPEKNYDNTEDLNMADSLKTIKRNINKKIRTRILCSVGAVLVLVLAFALLFEAPLKPIALSDIAVTAMAQPLGEAPDSVRITADATGERYTLEFPADADASADDTAVVDTGAASVVTWSSPYQIKKIKYADQTDDSTIYVEAFRTTLLNNKAKDNSVATSLAFEALDKIVFVDHGRETVLWRK